MSDVLEQDEIDALLKGVDSGAVDMSPKLPAATSEAKTYDLSTQARIVRGRMPTLDLINERLARALRLSVFRMLRRAPEISVLSVATPRYADYVPTLSVPTSLNQIRFQPLTGMGLIVFDAALVFALIDTYFGGTGRQAKVEDRDFTPTENQIIQMLLELVCAAAEEAWAPVLSAKVEFVSREFNSKFATFAHPSEVLVISRLSVDLDGKGGEIHIALPYTMIEPVMGSLRAGLQSERADLSEHWSQLLRNELEESEVELVTHLGTARMTVSSLIDMRPGDVIPVDFDGRANVICDSIPLFWGELGQLRGYQVVRVDQMNVRKAGNSLDAFVRTAQ